MRIKTMIVVIIAVLLTIVLMQNTEDVKFNFLFSTFFIPKLVMLVIVAAIAFILGVLVGRPGKPKYVQGLQDEINLHDKNKPGTLSDEDKDYIN